MRPERAVALLAGTPLFHGLGDAQLREVADAASLRSYSKGEFVFLEGERGDRLFVLAEGSSRSSSPHRTAKR